MNKKVFFVPASEEVENILEIPKPAKKYLPDWYKKLPFNFINSDGFEGAGPTRCMPFLDSFTSGYIHELQCDVEIQYNGIDPKTKKDLISYRWSSKFSRPIITRQEENGAPHSLPSFDGYYNTEFQWYTDWDPKTPDGYSTIYHHPFNRFDLPFQTFTGITDTDKWHGTGPVPFLIKRGFEGIIPAGTPIIQFTFIKRENWESSIKKYDKKTNPKEIFKLKKHFFNAYKKSYWQKKEYN